MEIDLNEPRIKPYEVYYGKLLERMPRLIAEGRTPASTATILERRVNSQNYTWEDVHVCTGDMILYHLNGNVKLVRDAQLLRNIHPKTRLHQGVIKITEDIYN